jgi:hypothetical protein
MPKAKRATWLYNLAGGLWILAGLLSLLSQRTWFDHIWRVIFGVAMGLFFISLGRQQARKTRDQ